MIFFLKNSSKFLILLLLFIGCTNDDTFKILSICPLTGNAASYGENSNMGLEFAIHEQNINGGILGKQISLIKEDSKGDPKVGGNIVRRYIDNNSILFTYSVVSGVAMAIKPSLEKNKIIHFSGVGTHKFLENSNYSIRNFFDAQQIGKTIAGKLIDKNYKRIALFYPNNEFGKSLFLQTKTELINNGLKKLETLEYEANNNDFKSELASVNLSKIEVIYIIGVGKSLGYIIKNILEKNPETKIVCDPLFENNEIRKILGEQFSKITYFDFVFPDENKNEAFEKSFKEKNNFEPDNFTSLSYYATSLYFSEVQKRGSINSNEIISGFDNPSSQKGNINNRKVDYKLVLKGEL